MFAIHRYYSLALGRERLEVKNFKSSTEMHNFLNRGDNSLNWIETSAPPRKRGTYIKIHATDWVLASKVDRDLLPFV